MSFGGNPPWQRNSLGNTNQQNASLQSQIMNSNFVGFQNMAMAQQAPQNNLSLIPPIGANIGALNNNAAASMFTNQHQSMQFQNARSGLNPNAFSSVQQSQMNLNNNQSGQVSFVGVDRFD